MKSLQIAFCIMLLSSMAQAAQYTCSGVYASKGSVGTLELAGNGYLFQFTDRVRLQSFCGGTILSGDPSWIQYSSGVVNNPKTNPKRMSCGYEKFRISSHLVRNGKGFISMYSSAGGHPGDFENAWFFCDLK